MYASQRRRRGVRLITTAALVAGAALALPATGQAAQIVFGSSLGVPATLDSANDIPPQPMHAGTDTAIWNVGLGNGQSPAASASGQVLSIRIKGCVKPGANGGAPNPYPIHFQDLKPQADGTFTINVTTQGAAPPTCGGGVDGNTVTSYAPVNFCVAQGDAVAFNDVGGFDSPPRTATSRRGSRTCSWRPSPGRRWIPSSR